jgi:serine beta-lactamase-like protein LACTB, mitochondrial
MSMIRSGLLRERPVAASRPIKVHTRRTFASALAVSAVLLLTSLPGTSRISAQNQKLSPQRRTALADVVSKFMATSQAPGVSVAAVEHGQLVWSEGFGMANFKDHVPATSHTLFRLASISKSLTASGAMLLWQTGKLDLDAPIQKYCPAFPQKDAPITTRELLGHLGGIRHYNSESNDDPEIGNTKHFDDPIAAGIKFFANDPLVAPPGTHFHYSTQGYTLVGCAIEGASGEKYVAYMRENVFAPAGMTSTQPDDATAIIPDRTNFYAKDKSGAVVTAEPLDSSYKIPGGGWLSSADDMARFEVALLNARILKPATIRAMWTPQKLSDGSTDEYGLGFEIDHQDGVLTVGHSGGQQGTSTHFLIAPVQGAGIVVLVNLEDADASTLAASLLKILLFTEPDKQPRMIEH